MTETVRRSRPVALALLGLLIAGIAVLLWGIVTTNLAVQAGRVNNAQLMAVFANSRHPDVAAQLATQLRVAKQYDAAAEIARDAVRTDPINVRALSTLGLSLEQIGDTRQATAIMRSAATLGWRDTPTLVWALQDAGQRDDVVRAMAIADALARRQVLQPLTRSLFFASLSDPRLRSALVLRLAKRPTWRATFFADVAERLPSSQLAGMESMLRQLAATAAPPSADEQLKYIGRLAALGDYAQARRFWASAFSISPDQLAQAPFDGRFLRIARTPAEAPKSPFEWQINPDLDDSVSLVTEGSKAGLRIEPGLSNGTIVAGQTLLLPPGEHLITAHLGAGTGQTAPVGWTLSCLPSKQPLLRTIVGNRNDELSVIRVTVPANCSAQALQLVALDRFEAQPVMIDAVAIQ